ncbi:MAG: hypothetical protein ABH873_09650 [Candidatus Firestonebacteria bacterium]
MKKVLFFLCVLVFLPVIGWGYYDDFNGYEYYYELIDDCESLTPQSAASWVVDTGTNTISIVSSKFGNGIGWDKGNTGNDSYIKGEGVYSTTPKDISGLSSGCLTFWYYIPTGFGATISRIEGMLTDSTTISAITSNKTVASKTTEVTLDGWNYFKGQLSVQGAPDYSSIKSIRVGLQTSTVISANGIIIDDIKVVSSNNTTNGVWNEASGVWEILDVSGNKVYYQNGSCAEATPPLFTKTTYRDFVYTAKVRLNDAGYTGLVFRKKDSNYYFFSLDVASNKIELRKYVGGFSDVASADTSTTLSTNTNYYLKVVCIGSSIKAYTSVTDESNYTERFNITDTNLLSPGHIGLLTNKEGYFDNIKVLPIPSYIATSGGDNEVKLYWTPYSYSGEIASYNIYRSTTSGGPYNDEWTSGNAYYTDTNVINKTTYYYKVTANVVINATTTEKTDIALSSEVSATPHPGVVVSNNPFTPNSSNPAFQKVTFTVYNPTNDIIELKVYQPTGVLINTVTVASGSDISWDGTNLSGGIVEGGVYVYQIKVSGGVAGSGSVILAK